MQLRELRGADIPAGVNPDAYQVLWQGLSLVHAQCKQSGGLHCQDG